MTAASQVRAENPDLMHSTPLSYIAMETLRCVLSFASEAGGVQGPQPHRHSTSSLEPGNTSAFHLLACSSNPAR